MKVLLRSDVKGVGRRGDIVSVSAGHARNFLLPNDLAVVANDGTVAQADGPQSLLVKGSRFMRMERVVQAVMTRNTQNTQTEAPHVA